MEAVARKQTKTAAAKIREDILAGIQSGVYKEGERLPSERQLAEFFSVSRPVVREALKELQALGLVEMRKNSGNYVRDAFSDQVLSFLGHEAEVTSENYREYIEARRVIETGIIPEVLDRLSNAKLRALEELNAPLDQSEMEEGVARDLAFHTAYVALAENKLISELYEIVMKPFANSAEYVLFSEEKRAEAKQLHEGILMALRERDPEQLKEAVLFQLEETARNIERHSGWSDGLPFGAS